MEAERRRAAGSGARGADSEVLLQGGDRGGHLRQNLPQASCPASGSPWHSWTRRHVTRSRLHLPLAPSPCTTFSSLWGHLSLGVGPLQDELRLRFNFVFKGAFPK